MIHIFGAVLLLAVLPSSVVGDAALYKGYKTYEVHTASRAGVDLLQSVGRDLELDFWSPLTVDRKSSVMVSPWNDGPFKAFLNEHNVTHRLLLDDVQRMIDRESISNEVPSRKRRDTDQNDSTPTTNMNGTSFEYFWSLAEIYEYLDMLNSTYPDMVKVMDYGTTYEKRPIKVITISTNGEVNGSRPVVLVDGGIHAREWASHMSVVYLIHQLVEHSAENMDLLTNTDWVIMPVVNPDGYEYTQKERLWRKNRAPISDSNCLGTDLNRNFPVGWKFYGSKCSVGYAGPTSGSELETQAVMRLMDEYANDTKVYLTVHSCGDYILYPYGYKHENATNQDDLEALGKQAAAAVKAIGGPEYAVGSAANLLYPANGSDDYIYDCLNVKYAYTLELSCSNVSGSNVFVISVAEMQQINKEAFEMFKVFGKFAGNQTISSE